MMINPDAQEKTFKDLFETYSKRLYEMACRHVSSSDAEDIVQELFLDIWQKRNEIEIKTTWDAYLFAVLKYRILRFLDEKNEMAKSLREAIHEAGNDKDILPFEELYDKIEKSIDLLPEKCKEIFTKRYYENLKIKDIAEKLHISTETVKQQLKRAKKILRTHLNDSLNDFLF